MPRRLYDYVVLPPLRTTFERSYLERLNRIAKLFFIAHVPVFAVVAAVNDTGPLLALVLTSLCALGPSLAGRLSENPRVVSIFSAVSAMCMGALLVHFGQGPLQIEMHFYFFVLIALLAVFANPSAIVVAAVTVAAHHLILFVVLPRSVFNYEASYFTVAVHALFVVLESVAASFVARSFFDNVIGLDSIVEARTAELAERNLAMKIVLDTVGQGFVRVGRDGVLSEERSAILARWLGASLPGAKAWDYFGKADEDVGIWMRMGWESLDADVLPLELVLDQMPRRLTRGAQTLELEYRPIFDGERLESLLVVVSDITSAVERERAEADRLELFAVFEKVAQDREGFSEFLREGREIVTRLTEAEELRLDEVRRLLHTLKGNAAIFGLGTFASVCHELESRIDDEGLLPGARELERLASAWRSTSAKVKRILGSERESIEIAPNEYQTLANAIDRGAKGVELASLISDWVLEPTEVRLARVAEQARGFARRLGKADPVIHVESNGLRLRADGWVGFWSAFIHVVRNAVDHGIETPAERALACRPPAGTLTLRTALDQREFVVSLTDDGRGIDWEAVARVAAERGLPHESREELVSALFEDGTTTRESVTEISGRGVGMGAIRAAVQELGGRVVVTSERGHGTVFEARFPREAMRAGSLVVTSRDAAARGARHVSTRRPAIGRAVSHSDRPS